LLALFGQTDCVWVCRLLEQQPTKGHVGAEWLGRE
jgi:hypothetical protein